MKYIICEDDTSGYYFWTLISINVLETHPIMVSPTEINKRIGNIKQGSIDKTLGIDKIADYIEWLTNKDNIDKTSKNTYIVCIDNVADNKNVLNNIDKIHRIIGRLPNFHIVNYICFEQIIVVSDKALQFFPKLQNRKEYSIIREHYKKYGLGHSRQLEVMLKNNNISYKTTETVFARLIEYAMKYKTQQIKIQGSSRVQNNDVMVHHYILKGNRKSICWTTDCTPMCPNDKCWKVNTRPEVECDICTSNFKNYSQSCIMINDTVKRHFSEQDSCNRQLPFKLKERLKWLFNITDITNIDTF